MTSEETAAMVRRCAERQRWGQGPSGAELRGLDCPIGGGQRITSRECRYCGDYADAQCCGMPMCQRCCSQHGRETHVRGRDLGLADHRPLPPDHTILSAR